MVIFNHALRGTMTLRVLATIFLIFITSSVFADGSSSDTEEFSLKANYDKICEFIESHGDDIILASHNKVLKRDGLKVKLQNSNPVSGRITFTVQETVKKGDYKSEMIESHEGGLTDQATEISIKKNNGRCDVTVTMRASIKNPTIGSFGLKLHLDKATRGIKNYLRKNLDS